MKQILWAVDLNSASLKILWLPLAICSWEDIQQTSFLPKEKLFGEKNQQCANSWAIVLIVTVLTFSAGAFSEAMSLENRRPAYIIFGIRDDVLIQRFQWLRKNKFNYQFTLMLTRNTVLPQCPENQILDGRKKRAALRHARKLFDQVSSRLVFRLANIGDYSVFLVHDWGRWLPWTYRRRWSEYDPIPLHHQLSTTLQQPSHACFY